MTDHTIDDLRTALRDIAADASRFDPEATLARIRSAGVVDEDGAAAGGADVRAGAGTTISSPPRDAGEDVRAGRSRRTGRVLPWATGAAAAGLLVAAVTGGTAADQAARGPVATDGGIAVSSSTVRPEATSMPLPPGVALLGTTPDATPAAGQAAPAVVLMTRAPSDPTPASSSVLLGSITTTPHGCVVVRGQDGRLVPVRWPAGTRPMSSVEGTVAVMPDGRTFGGVDSLPLLSFRGTSTSLPGRCGSIAPAGLDIATVEEAVPAPSVTR